MGKANTERDLPQRHLVTAMNEFSEVAEGLAIVLRAEFSGKAVIEHSGPISCLQ